MARIVELVGPPGVGKTVLVAALGGRRLPDGRRLVPVTELTHPPRRGVPAVVDRRLPRALDPGVRRQALAAREAEWGPFLAHVVEVAGPGSATPLRRLRALSYTLATLELLAVAAERPASEVVLLDEGPLQRALTLLGTGAVAEDLDRHVALAPPTDLVLHLRADADEVARRVAARAGTGRVTDGHAGRSEVELRAVQAAERDLLADVAVRTSAGRPVVTVDVPPGDAAVRTVLGILSDRLPR